MVGEAFLFEIQDGGADVVTMDATAVSDQNNSSVLFTSASTLSSQNQSTTASDIPTQDLSDNSNSQVGTALVNKRKSELIAGTLRTPCPTRPSNPVDSIEDQHSSASHSDFLVVQSTPLPGRFIDGSFASYLESQSLDSFNLEDRERIIYTSERESEAALESYFDRYRDRATPSVISGRKIVSATRTKAHLTDSEYSNWFERVDSDNFRSVGLEGQPGVGPAPNPVLAPARLSFAGDLHPDNSLVGATDTVNSTSSRDSTLTSDIPAVNPSVTTPPTTTGEPGQQEDCEMNPEKFQELFLKCFNEAITCEANVNFIRTVVSGDINALHRKIDVVSAESKITSSGVVKVTADLTNLDLRLQACEGGIQQLTQSVEAVGKSVNNLTNTGLPPAQTDQFNEIQQQVNTLTGQMDMMRAGPQGQGVVNEVRNLSSKVQQLEATNNLKLLIFDGIPEVPGEMLPEHLVQSLHGALDPPLKLSDIETARRIGTVRPGRPKSILVEFVYVSVRRRIYRDRLQLARTKPSVFIGEFLPKDVEYLFFLARRERGENRPLSRVWTWDCQVYVTRLRGSRGSLIRNERELREFIAMPVYGPEIRPEGWVNMPSTSQNASANMQH